MNVIKRDGKEVNFDRNKIVNAVVKAFKEVDGDAYIEQYATDVGKSIAYLIESQEQTMSVEKIQDIVETELMEHNEYAVAKAYIKYRYKRELARKSNTTDGSILSLIDCSNEEIKQENSNKNPVIISTQRDYMAGEVSKDLSRRILLPQDVVDAHDKGLIHFHDMDYFAQRCYNCCLVNLEDMLQNGTVISGVMIEKPHSFSTACNVATQAVAQVASSQYGLTMPAVL